MEHDKKGGKQNKHDRCPPCSVGLYIGERVAAVPIPGNLPRPFEAAYLRCCPCMFLVVFVGFPLVRVQGNVLESLRVVAIIAREEMKIIAL
ncbi:hypothetical protein BGZ61DRAFT_529873 [Ilyonectria robusta]|uniref:uncharacterized protein n=1 Tax=Ilyonectria robusta TaxID=1079257 RepID=UPI001E8E7735|nr:uncharacterized protein BGZ61DRAFT_529873 [Ilyonectria robusta]KAH8729721.1 hypothetical protein BGZ61DRAFT_529873 [Ilyonectria robusta]